MGLAGRRADGALGGGGGSSAGAAFRCAADHSA